MDPTDAVRAMRDRGYSADEVRSAIRHINELNVLERSEISWLDGAVNMLAFHARSNPYERSDVPTMFRHFEEHIHEVQDRIRADLLGMPRENPSRLADEKGPVVRAMRAFFQPISYASSKTTSQDGSEYGSRDAARYNLYTHESQYRLWDNTIAEMNRPTDGRPWTLELSDAGYATPTTHRRLNQLLEVGREFHPELAKERIFFYRAKYHTFADRNGKEWKVDPKTKLYTIKLKPIPMFDVAEAAEAKIVPFEMKQTSMNKVQTKIDAIESEMNTWQVRNDPSHSLDYSALSEKIGKRDELSKLLRERMRLMAMERDNPQQIAWRD
jgi:hypothetical protein